MQSLIEEQLSKVYSFPKFSVVSQATLATYNVICHCLPALPLKSQLLIRQSMSRDHIVTCDWSIAKNPVHSLVDTSSLSWS